MIYTNTFFFRRGLTSYPGQSGYLEWGVVLMTCNDRTCLRLEEVEGAADEASKMEEVD